MAESFHYKTEQSFKDKLSELALDIPFSPELAPLRGRVTIGGRLFHNSIAYQPMEGRDARAESGAPGELTRRRYRRFAEGGPGLIWFEAVAIVKEGRSSPGNLYLDEKNLPEFQRLVSDTKETCLKTHGFEPYVIAQLMHAGRYSRPGSRPEPVIAFHIPAYERDDPLPESAVVTDDRLKLYEERMARSAAFARRAGFDGVDVKCCHGYLACELLSARERPGEYGGPFENRVRHYINCLRAASSALGGDLILASRLNVCDGAEGGFGVARGGGTEPDLEEPLRLVGLALREGVGLINVTGGNPYAIPHVTRPYDAGGPEPPEHPLRGVARLLHLASEVKKGYPALPVVASGFSYLRQYAKNAGAAMIRENRATFMGLGRISLAYPHAAADILAGTDQPPSYCITCSKCSHLMKNGGMYAGCPVRDRDVYLPYYRTTLERTK